ncbi:2Fe-2S iron-sulfur cluster-binding protein [Afipia massiliensis]|uniref:2Fe-2S iron-sulfur cluster-binding protein n=1 Tax=Afipia massiliensis TaxID=211460 RepID=UPI00160F0543|nr:2Fe-2S iron-sulfur cluster-binding protein [Afipia massiliensis]
MVQITLIQPSGASLQLDVPEGWSLMQAAVKNGIDGIVAECGGSCVCATCHVYVQQERFAELPPPGEDELELLDEVKAERRPNSRLSCQIKAAPELNGLIVTIPEYQT